MKQKTIKEIKGTWNKAFTTVEDNIGGKQTLKGTMIGLNTISVKEVEETKDAIIIRKEDINHIFLLGNVIIVELEDTRRLFFTIHTES